MFSQEQDFTKKEELQEDDIWVSLEGFTRYKIYPNGNVFDTERKRLVSFNRHLNFAMFPDSKAVNEVGKYIYEMKNIRSLIRFLVDRKTPGFVDYLPEFRPSDYMDALAGRKIDTYTKERAGILHGLRRQVGINSSVLLDLVSKGLDFEQAKVNFNQSQIDLEAFKQDNPDYESWPKYIEEAGAEVIAEILQEEADVKAQIEAYYEEIKELKIKIRAIKNGENLLF